MKPMSGHGHFLTLNQVGVLKVLMDADGDGGEMLLATDIQERAGIASKQGTFTVLQTLVSRGHVQRAGGKARNGAFAWTYRMDPTVRRQASAGMLESAAEMLRLEAGDGS